MKKTLSILIAGALLSPVVQAHQSGEWLVRGGITSVSPNDDSSNVFVGGTDLGVGVDADSNAQLGLNVAYFISEKWAIELLAATPFSHDITLKTVGALGDTKQLPPTISANYYFASSDKGFNPYVGIGLNYTMFFSEGFTDANKNAGFSNLKADDSIGLAFQVGFDYELGNQWHINGSARWIDIDTEATFDLNGTQGRVDIEIDPSVYTLSLGYRF